MKKIFNDKLLKIVAACISIVIGLLVMIFAIIRWAKPDSNTNPEQVVSICLAIGFLSIGFIIGLLGFVDSRKSLEVPFLSASVTLVTLGAFLCFKNESALLLELFINMIVPILICVLGGFLLVKAIISLCNDLDRNTCIYMLVFGVVFFVAGFLLTWYRFNNGVNNFMWVMVGISILLGGIGTLLAPKFSKE